MPEVVKMAFQRRIIDLPTPNILPLKKLSKELKLSATYARIARSIDEVGIIEPLMVARSDDKGKFMLLDGHVRLDVLVDRGVTSVRCLLADDDETFTYNKRINRLSTIQGHYMIVKALERGVSEEKLARALNVDVSAIRRRRSLLNGICPEVVHLLDEKIVNPVTFDALRKMRPLRQIEVAELMSAAGNFSGTYAKALLAATRQADLVLSDHPKKVGGMTGEQMARMEKEMASLQQDVKSVEASYGDDVLNLVIAGGYLSKLVNNREIEKYLAKNHPEILSEFRAIIASHSLMGTEQAEVVS